MRTRKLMMTVMAALGGFLGVILSQWVLPTTVFADCSGIMGRSCIRINQGNAFLANTEQGLTIYCLGQPDAPRQIGCLDTPGCISDIDFSSGYAYVVDSQSGLLIVDVSNPEKCDMVATNNKYGTRMQTFTIFGNHALATVSGQGARIFDVSEPNHPREIAVLDRPAQIHGVRLVGETAYLADSNGDMHVVDLSDPSHPRTMQVMNVPGRPRSMGVSGSTLYLTTSERQMHLFDISAPQSPQFRAAIALGNSPVAAVSGDYVYIADLGKGFVAMDIRDPLNPKLMARESLDGVALGICIRDNHAYLSMAKNNEIRTIDLRRILARVAEQ